MSALSPSPDGDQDRAPQLLAIFWTQIPISFVFVALRLYVKASMRNLGKDDYFMFVTWALYLLALVCSTETMLNGGARHLYYLTPAEIHTVLKWNWISQPFGTMALAFGKASVAFLLLKIIGPNTVWRKWFLWTSMGVFFILATLASIFNYAQCNPPRALWDHVPGAVCWKPTIQPDFAIFVSSYSTLLDFCLAFIPITIVWKLKLSLAKRVGLCILMGLGVFAGICAAIKTAQLPELSARSDITWATYGLYAWSSSELFLIIICGSVPSLRPLYDTISKGKPLRPNKPSHFNNSDSGGSNGFRLGSSTSQQGYSSAKGTNTTRVTTNGMSSSNSRVDAHHVINPERGYDINVMLNKEPVRANEYNIV